MKILYYLVLISSLVFLSCSADTTGSSSSDSGSGQAGSMARFSIVDDFLYAINAWEVSLFTLTNPQEPTRWSRVPVAWDIETLFPYGDALFIGAESGMHIYDISNPAYPKYRSEFTHVRSCDPVVVQDSTAYVTLRSGTRCWGTTDELEILNVSDLSNPRLLTSYPMENPHGLTVADSLLVICDGEAGIKCFDASDPYNLKLLQHIPGMTAYDVIKQENRIIVIAEEGLYQFDITTLPYTLISHIPIGNAS